MGKKTLTLEEVEDLIHVSAEEVLAAVSDDEPLLVKYAAARLQNQKMKALLVEHYSESEED